MIDKLFLPYSSSDEGTSGMVIGMTVFAINDPQHCYRYTPDSSTTTVLALLAPPFGDVSPTAKNHLHCHSPLQPLQPTALRVGSRKPFPH